MTALVLELPQVWLDAAPSRLTTRSPAVKLLLTTWRPGRRDAKHGRNIALPVQGLHVDTIHGKMMLGGTA